MSSSNKSATPLCIHPMGHYSKILSNLRKCFVCLSSLFLLCWFYCLRCACWVCFIFFLFGFRTGWWVSKQIAPWTSFETNSNSYVTVLVLLRTVAFKICQQLEFQNALTTASFLLQFWYILRGKQAPCRQPQFGNRRLSMPCQIL